MTTTEATPKPLLPAAYDLTWSAPVAAGTILLVVAVVHLARGKDTTPTETALWALVVPVARSSGQPSTCSSAAAVGTPRSSPPNNDGPPSRPAATVHPDSSRRTARNIA
ncbi:hypothetical protein [Georgenia sp. AZ-5]|uniref:hypothetical protein n=1 Tax=Georgenia sp. AZ-5 TaxID=3367526 RepID=UPI0037545A02